MKNSKFGGLKMLQGELVQPVLFIVGATASGKTDLSIKLAKYFGTEIISADSRYFYKTMNIGTAKPGKSETGNIIHHQVDIADPDETISVAEYKLQVTSIIDHLHRQGMFPIVVGGTGQYVHAILHNWKMPVVEPDLLLREKLENYANKHGKLKLFEILAKIDPESASIIDYRNSRRTIRALEVIFKTGIRFSEQRQKDLSPYTTKIIGINWSREELYQRIDQRIARMIDQGLIEEVESLLNRGYSMDLPSMSAIGYREIARYLKKESSLDEAIILMKRNSRRYVRRQANWFKTNDPEIRWFEGNNLNFNLVVEYIEGNSGWKKPEKLEK